MEPDIKNLLSVRSFEHLTDNKFSNDLYQKIYLRNDFYIQEIYKNEWVVPKINIKPSDILKAQHEVKEIVPRIFRKITLDKNNIFKFYYLNIFGEKVFIK